MKSKYIFKSNPPAIKDAEIKQIMDFDKLLNQHNLEQMPPKRFSTGQLVKGIKPYVFTVLVASLTTVATYYIIKTQEKDLEAAVPSKVEEIVTLPEVLKPETQELPIEKKEEPESVRSSPKKSSAPSTIDPTKEEIVDAIEAETESSTIALSKGSYIQAMPIGGFDSLYLYFSKELTYPQAHIAEAIQGVVTIQFTINKLGRVQNPEIVQSLGEAFDQEAMRVILSMPIWTPATINGKNTSSKITIPLTFKVSPPTEPTEN